MIFKKSSFVNLLFYIFVVIATLCDFIASINYTNSFIVCFSFLIIGIISIILFIKDKGFITLKKMIYVYLFIFCYLAPFHQYVSGNRIHDFSAFSDGEYLFGNFLIFLFIIVFEASIYIFERKGRNIKIVDNRNFSISEISLYIMSIVSILCIFLLWKKGNLISINSNLSTDSETTDMIIVKFLRFFPISCLMLTYYGKKYSMIKSKKVNKFLFIFSLISIIIFFPLNGSIGRFFLLSVYLMFIAAIYEDSKKKSLFLLFIFLGFAVVFPTLNFFKYHSFSEIGDFYLSTIDFNYIDFDSYEMFLASLRYYNHAGSLHLFNLVTALLCFIPRSIFTYKYPHTGVIVAKYFYLPFVNLSCPIFGEFYLAGGFIGYIVLIIIFAWVINGIYLRKYRGGALGYGLYFISIGMIFAFMRGAMLPVTSTWMILSICYYIVYKLCSFF